SEKGVNDILPRLDSFTEVNPFFYTVKQNGELFPNGSLNDAEWKNLKTQAKQKGVHFIPTVMWANADAMDEVFRDESKRQAHIRSLAKEVYAHGLDGIDIDYEAKYARTREYFSLFLRDLEEAIGYDKLIMCTIEARTPLDSRYLDPADIPKDIEYANDFKEINKYCDRVRIMAYDQGRFDKKLNEEKKHPYIPVADVDWVRKVVELTAVDIDKEKIVIGVPTYGYEYDMFIDGDGDTVYSRLWSFNPNYVEQDVKPNVTGEGPTRNSAGELFFTYPARQSPDGVVPLPNATRVMSWSDAEAIRDKAELAEELGVRGIAVFKIDGGQDQNLWSVLSEYKDKQVAIGVQTNPSTIGVVIEDVQMLVPEIDLEYGDRREEVRLLQQFLNDEDFTVAQSGGGSLGNETTFFGPATQNALIRFQKHHGITPAVGYFGPLTRATMQSL
ncbi:MAG: glycosyl hydrolase family 18 protein, partial [Candidatus Paceibacterota bacterium]